MRTTGLRLLCAGLLGVTGMLASFRADAQSVVPAYQPQLRLDTLLNLHGSPTQMAFGPDGRPYIRLNSAASGRRVDSYASDKPPGTLSDQNHAVTGSDGIGIAFHQTHMSLTPLDWSIVKHLWFCWNAMPMPSKPVTACF